MSENTADRIAAALELIAKMQGAMLTEMVALVAAVQALAPPPPPAPPPL